MPQNVLKKYYSLICWEVQFSSLLPTGFFASRKDSFLITATEFLHMIIQKRWTGLFLQNSEATVISFPNFQNFSDKSLVFLSLLSVNVHIFLIEY